MRAEGHLVKAFWVLSNMPNWGAEGGPHEGQGGGAYFQGLYALCRRQ
jgi:hypothetical protein